MSVVPVTENNPASRAAVHVIAKSDLYAEHIPAHKSRSLMDTANVKVGDSPTLGPSHKALLAARDIHRTGEVIYLEFVPKQRVYSQAAQYTFRKHANIHLDSIGGVRYVNHSFTPNAQVYFPCCIFSKDNGGGHFIGLEVIAPISSGEEITVDYTKTERPFTSNASDSL